MAAAIIEGKFRAAFSGIYGYPFRNSTFDEDLNNKKLQIEKRIDNAMTHLTAPIIGNIQASAEYREFVFKNALSEMMQALEGIS